MLELVGTMALVKYRAASAADVDQIARLHADSWSRHYRGAYSDTYLDKDVWSDRGELWAERFRAPRMAVSPSSPTVTAMSSASPTPALISTRSGEHCSITSTCGFPLKRQGVGRALMAATAHGLEHRRPSSGLYLWVLKQNTAAQAFYSAMGGVLVGDKLGGPFPGGGRAPVLRYAWPDPSVLLSQEG